MYELTNGSKRLVNALYSISDNDTAINRIAYYLNYIPAQLKEDIEAINDYMREEREHE